MFRTLTRRADSVRLQINDRPVEVAAGSSVWAAMALAGETTTKCAQLSGQPRSAYCAMGVCFECLVEIDEQPDRQACLVEVAEGMCVRSQTITEESEAALPRAEDDQLEPAEVARVSQL